MRLINLESADVEELHWQQQGDGTYLDFAGYNEISIISVRDGMSSEIVTTVLFAGSPVLVIRSGDVPLAQPPNISPVWSYTSPMFADEAGPDAQAWAAFMTAIGEADEEAAAWVAEHGAVGLFESELVGDGHQAVEFVNMVARAVHREWPDDTPPVEDATPPADNPPHEQAGGRGGEI